VKRWKALILAGGLGTRLRPLTDTLPKCLVPIAGRPLLDYWFDALKQVSISDVLINTHHLPEQVRGYISDKNSAGWRVEEAWEPELLGSAGTVTANRGWCEDADHCLVIYADNLSTVDLQPFLEFHLRHGDPFSIFLFRTQNPSACGIATVDEVNRVTAFVEKPEQPDSNLANGGLYVITADAWREIADQGSFDLGFDVLPRFVNRMRGYEFDGFHLDIGTPEALTHANEQAPHLFSAASSS